MPTIFIDLPHNNGSSEIESKNGRQWVIVKEFLNIIEEYCLDIDEQDLQNILHISSL